MITPNRCRKTFYKSPIPFHSKGGIEGLFLSLIKGVLKSHKQYKTESFPQRSGARHPCISTFVTQYCSRSSSWVTSLEKEVHTDCKGSKTINNQHTLKTNSEFNRIAQYKIMLQSEYEVSHTRLVC